MSKNTPGPWAIRETATHMSVIGANNETIFHDDKRCPNVIEDARLIAAAPDMLEVLQAVVELWDNYCFAHGDGQRSSLHTKARDAIAKAEGIE